MQFSTSQYDQAIAALQAGKLQLEADGKNCSVCGDSGHQAFDCGHNPLVAMTLCELIALESRSLHETLHYLAGFNKRMGEQVGPAKVVVPEDQPVKL